MASTTLAWASGVHEDENSDAQTLINDLLQRVRELALDLRPQMLDDLGLVSALEWLFRTRGKQLQMRIHFTQTGLAKRFSPTVETAAFRIIQEAVLGCTD